MRRLLMTTALVLTALPAFADDAAILLGVDRYRNFDRLRGGTDVIDMASDFAKAGYAASEFENKSLAQMIDGLERFEEQVPTADRLVVAMTGRFATDGTRSWLLEPDANISSIFDVGRNGVSVEGVMRVLARLPGKAVLVIGRDADDRDRIAPSLREGIGSLDVPQGVTVLVGEPSAANAALSDAILTPGEDIIASMRGNGDVAIYGYRPRDLVMQPSSNVATGVEPRPYVVDSAADTIMWEQIKSRDTVAAYRTYLQAFPRGAHVQEANDAIKAIQTEPNRDARLAEEALNLTRDQRRAVQRNLTQLNYNTRGIDGIFGRGSRAAITAWQRDNGASQTSYLTRDQVDRIQTQASKRAAELEAQEAAAREAELRADRAFWQDTGANGREAGLRSYLERYPEGFYADEARARLNQIIAEKEQTASRADQNAWNNASRRNTIRSYNRYLRDHPRGAYVRDARTRVAGLQANGDNAPARDRAAAQEATLQLNAVTRGLVQGRLRQLGFDTGTNIGQFDDATRRAIRQFQESRKLEVTGYLTQQAIVMLLTGGN